jgi:hypothetical protein
MLRSRSSVLLLPLVLSLACASAPTNRPPAPVSSPTVQAELGERDVLQASEEYARMRGFALSEGRRDAVLLRPNYWLVRFSLGGKDRGGLLNLEFDGASHEVVHEEVIPGGEPGPATPPSP